MSDEQRFWIAVWAIIALALGMLLIAGSIESTKTAALCKQAIEQKEGFAIAKLCR